MNESHTWNIIYERGTGGKVITEHNVTFPNTSDEAVVVFFREDGDKVELGRKFLILAERKTELSFD